jgi:hypothetical protein
LHYYFADIMVNLFEAPPTGYHFQGQAPKINPATGHPTKLARFIEDDKVNRKDKYLDLFCKNKADIEGKPQITCLCCGKMIACFYYKSGDNYDMANFFRHIQSKHPEQLSPADQLSVIVDKPSEKLGIAAMLVGQFSYSTNKAKSITLQKKKVTLAIANMVAQKGSFPFKMVEDPAFRAGVRKRDRRG